MVYLMNGTLLRVALIGDLMHHRRHIFGKGVKCVCRDANFQKLKSVRWDGIILTIAKHCKFSHNN